MNKKIRIRYDHLMQMISVCINGDVRSYAVYGKGAKSTFEKVGNARDSSEHRHYAEGFWLGCYDTNGDVDPARGTDALTERLAAEMARAVHHPHLGRTK